MTVNKKNCMIIAFVFSSIAGFIIFLSYTILVFAFNAILLSSNLKDFVFSMYNSLQFGIWFSIALSFLLGFISLTVFLIQQKPYKYKRNVFNFLLFLIISFAIGSSFLYYGTFEIIFTRDEKLIFYIIFFAAIVILSAYLVCMLKYLFIYFYRLILEAFSLPTQFFIVTKDNSIAGVSSEDDLKQKLFDSNLHTSIAFAMDSKKAVAIMSFRIAHRDDVISEYGFDRFVEIEKEIMDSVIS